ncbi:hypothetical protein COV82_00330 [Candidatus Peregrinibacteria bacterium CG11_big_fil_rev_8_21_14_0_20_46_8]|nr:MAG: hypothetical protein COV82_00330 [Candidatus Peregrinibacteria bacterium CG11_big_fil_rev_8_21_14_0_20_46_8]
MREKFAAFLLIVASSFAYFIWEAQPDGLLHIYILNVGQGDAILIRTPNGTNILNDGSAGSSIMQELGAVLPYFDRTIDYAILSHPDRDHIEGLIHVARRVKIEKFYMNGAVRDNFLVRGLLSAIREYDIPIILADDSKDILLDDGVKLDLLYPFKLPLNQKDALNNTSIVFMLEYGETRALFTGDIEKETESEIVAAGVDIRADILKVAHHGSRSSSIQPMLDKIQPKIALISAGRDNKFGHPHPEVLERFTKMGVAIHRTDINGRIEIIVSPTDYTIK